MATDNGKLVSAHVQKNSILYLVDCDTIAKDCLHYRLQRRLQPDVAIAQLRVARLHSLSHSPALFSSNAASLLETTLIGESSALATWDGGADKDPGLDFCRCCLSSLINASALSFNRPSKSSHVLTPSASMIGEGVRVLPAKVLAIR